MRRLSSSAVLLESLRRLGRPSSQTLVTSLIGSPTRAVRTRSPVPSPLAGHWLDSGLLVPRPAIRFGSDHHVVHQIILAQRGVSFSFDAIDVEGPDQFTVTPVCWDRHFKVEAISPREKVGGLTPVGITG